MSVPRSVHTADATGAEIFRALRNAIVASSITRLQGIACRLALGPQPEKRVVGVWVVLDEGSAAPPMKAHPHGLVLVTGRAVLLAAGGCGGLYASTTNRDGATADGVALAYAAGATLIDMEFVQFHPTGLRIDRANEQSSSSGGGSWRPLITEALRGAGAVLVDHHGQRFMPSLHPDAELAPRHVVTKDDMCRDPLRLEHG
jgi:L-aspartate oxidase